MWDAVFRFLFKYPPVAFERGRLALASGWPPWVLLLLIAGAAVLVGIYLLWQQPRLGPAGKVFVWAAQSLSLAILLLLLWRPSLIVSALLPQQNVLAVLVDNSASMNLADDGVRRIDRVRQTLDDSGPLLAKLRQNFQVRTYSFSSTTHRLASAKDLNATGTSTGVEDALAEVYSELRHLPLAGIVLVTDGAQNVESDSGGGSPELLQEIEARKIPIYSLGVGREEFSHDLQLDELDMPRTALPGALVNATVTISQTGYVGQTAKLEVREDSKLIKSKDVSFGAAPVVTVPIAFTPETKGLRQYTVSIVAPDAEPMTQNNSQSRLMEIEDRQAKVLYIEGEPRWEYKFIREALEQEPSLRLVSLLRTSQNKFYRQGVKDPQELQESLPDTKNLFQYDGLILGSISASFFSPEQQKSIYDFVSRRGGGILFLGGRQALAAGGYESSTLADLLPVDLKNRTGPAELQYEPAQFQLTARGAEQLQLSSDETINREDWSKLPPLGTYQIAGAPKPGAVVLGEAVPKNGQHYPVLVSQRFGRGRGILFATDGSWRWRMGLEASNHSHQIFWRQLVHSLIAETPPFVSIAAEKALYADETGVKLTAHVYDEQFQPVDAATAVATIHSPDGSAHQLTLDHSPDEDGVFVGQWDAAAPGVYRVDLDAQLGGKSVGTAYSYFQRANGILEYFSAEQNVALLKRLAEQTGGKYYPLSQASSLPEQLTYSPAGVSMPEVRDLWDMPFWLLLLFLLKGSEWVLRKHWKTV